MAFTREGLIEYMSNELSIDTSEIDDQTLLFTNGIVDSFMLISVLTYIEGQTGLKIHPRDVIHKNFDSIERMLAYVAKRLSA